MKLYHGFFILFVVSHLSQISFCNSDEFQTTVDGFMEAFDDVYSTELNYQTTDEVNVGNEISSTLDTSSDLGEAPLSTSEDERELEPVREEPVVTETVFLPGSDIRHELTEEVRALAERALAAISDELRLVNVTEAFSMVTDKVQRSLRLVVTGKDCDGENCERSCRVELVSHDKDEQVTWHNCLEASDANEVQRIKRGAVGGFKQVDEEEAKQLADIAVQTLDSIDADDNKRTVTQILRAQKQLVNGIMYHLTLEVGLTDCKESDDKCEGKINDYNICKILMQRLFAAETPNNAQVIKSECSPIAQAKALDSKKNLQRTKRHATVDGIESNMILDEKSPAKKTYSRSNRLMGGKHAQDPESDKIKELSEFALGEIDKSTNSLNKQKIVRVVDARSQVVSGVKYFLRMELVETNCRKGSDKENCSPAEGKALQSCDIVVWEKAWEKFRRVTKVSCSSVENRKKRGIPGGLSAADPNDAKIQEMAQFAVAQLDAKSNSLNAQKLISVKEAKTQVVQECDVVVNERVWEKKTELISAKCSAAPSNKKRSTREVLGGLSAADPNDAKIQEMAQFAVAQLDAKSNSLNAQKLISVKEAKTQVVAGTNYHLKLQLVETNCRKGSPQNSQCEATSGKVVQECDVVVNERVWEKKTELISAKCSAAPSNKKRSTRGIPGGLSAADPNDAKIQEMAQFAVAQLDAKSNSLNAQKLISVKEAKTQVVAGVNYYLKLQLVETGCPKGSALNSECQAASNKAVQECDVVIYDVPWEKHRQMTSAKCSAAPASKKRSTRQLVGGKRPEKVDDPRVQEIAQYAVAQLNSRSNSANAQKLVQVKDAQLQVVAGINYFLKLQLVETSCRKGSQDANQCEPAKNKEIQECDVVVYDRAWEKHRELSSAKCSTASRRKREVLVGGLTPSNVNGDEVQELALFAVEDMNSKSNSPYKQTLVEVISAHTQVVSGLNYHLILRIAESNCKKSELKSANCSPKGSTPSQECDITIWSQPWLKKKQVTKSECKRSASEQKNGEPDFIDPEAPEVQAAAKLSLKTIDRLSNAMFKHALLRVTYATVQINDVTSKKYYYLTMEVGLTECHKSDPREDCPVSSTNSMSDKCNVVVWTQSWLNEVASYGVESASCGRRSKRSTVKDLHLRMFEEFKAKYNKVYTSEMEHQRRFRIFRANLKKIQYLQDNEQGTATYGPNMFADLSAAEFKRMYTGLKSGPAPKPSPHHMRPATIPAVQLPENFDWRDHNVVTPVKNQGQCGSCWAFSVTGNVEGQWALKHQQLLSLSEQELVDCDKTDSGCNGGYMTQAYEAIEKLGGLETEKEYPYDAKDETCKFNQSDVQAIVVSSVNITTNETEIAQWLYTNGPISIGLNANAMQFYMGGVSHPFKFLCDKNQLDHGVLLVGFGVHRTSIRHKLLPYWLVKNSWGPHWGEKGYYRVYRGDSTCGVNQMCSSAVVG